MGQTKKRNLILVVVIVVVIIFAIIAVLVLGHKKANAPEGAGGVGMAGSGTAMPSSTTYAPVPANVVVPSAGATSTGDVAVPKIESAAAPNASTKYRSFTIMVDGNGFTPSTVAVNVGDTVNLQIGATSGNYDFTQPDLGFHVLLPQGQTKTVQFSPMTAGKYLFYCSSCGGPAKGPVGYIIVVAP